MPVLQRGMERINLAQGHASKLGFEPQFQQLCLSPDSHGPEDKVRNSDFHLAGPLDRFRQKATSSNLLFIIILAAVWRSIGGNRSGGETLASKPDEKG